MSAGVGATAAAGRTADRGGSAGVSGAIQGCPTGDILDHTAGVSWDPGAYGRAFADVYDEWYGERDDPAEVVDRIASVAGAPRGRRLLELGVGTGRLAIPLADAGWQVAGLDASAEMLDVLAAKTSAVEGRLGDASVSGDYPDRPFSVVLAAYNFLSNLLSAEAQLACLRSAALVSDDEGWLFVESFVPDPSPSVGGEVVDGEVVDGEVIAAGPVTGVEIRTTVDRASGVVVGEHRDGDGLRRPWRVRPIGPDELDAMAAAAGWRLECRWETWSGVPFVAAESPNQVSAYGRAPRG